jgi:hypothetical protein
LVYIHIARWRTVHTASNCRSEVPPRAVKINILTKMMMMMMMMTTIKIPV